MKLYNLLRESQQEAEVSALDKAMGSAFNQLGQELETGKQIAQANVQKANIQVTEAVGVVAIIGMLLAAPKVVELMAKGLQKLFSVYKSTFKKGAATSEQQQTDLAKSIIDFTHKWHKQYIKGIGWMLKVTGLFKKAGISDKVSQDKAAELIYYTIIAGLAVYSGIGAASAFKSAATTADLGSFSIGSLETAMSAIKSGEVLAFLKKLNIV